MILESFSGHDINEFLNDFLLLMKMGMEMEQMYSEGNNAFYHNKSIFEKCCTLFTQKYQTFILKPFIQGSGKSVKLFFPDKDVKKIYREACSRIEGLVGVSNTHDQEVPVSSRQQVEMELANVRDKIYINYNPDSIILEYRRKEDMVELVYDPQAILKNKDSSPEFKLCCYYALKGGFDRNVNMQEAAKGFIFHTGFDTHEGRFGAF